MHDLDLKLLRWMRTHGHSPGLEGVAVALGKAGNNGPSGSCSASRSRSSTARAGSPG